MCFKKKNLDLDSNLLDSLTTATNRSKGQTLFLLELLDNDLEKLILLEEKIKNNFIFYCPGDKEECERILSLNEEKKWFELGFTYKYL